ncbi:peroxidase 43-like [Vicia villosa]|uniref:peroxidase 43-like n=1 Tax=Vicia villosa TaxID=3911 RepID=UPI00273BFDAC|nr:peroxidase 43-like [Vicia villosa]
MSPFVFLSLLFLFLIDGSKGQLRVGFYSNTCYLAEHIVHDVVREASLSDPTVPAVLLRLHFHDCFVEGCDGSVLIDNVREPEKDAFEHLGLRGFDVIEKAKAKLEESCPGVVSCADIVALAAREAIVMTNGPWYKVPTGRRDGLVSDKSHAGDIPDVRESIQQLKTKFRNKGLTDKDLVLLSAAHTIGTTACFFMTKRLYNFFPSGGGSDPAISPSFLPELQAKCPRTGHDNDRLAMDIMTERKFDKNILRNIREGFAVLESDARLNDDARTKAVMESYLGPLTPILGPSFENDFVESIVKMGQIGVKTGSDGNIRRVCSKLD